MEVKQLMKDDLKSSKEFSDWYLPMVKKSMKEGLMRGFRCPSTGDTKYFVPPEGNPYIDGLNEERPVARKIDPGLFDRK